MYLPLETLNIHHKDWLTYSGGTDRSGELCYNFSISNDLTQMINFSTRILTVLILTVLLFWVYFFLMMLVFVLQWLSLNWEILTMLLSQFLLTFHHIHNVFLIIWEIIHGRISLNSVLLLLLVNFVGEFSLELISLIESIRSSLTHLHGFQQLVLLPKFLEITFFICTKRKNLPNLK